MNEDKDISELIEKAKESLDAAKSLFESGSLNGYQIKTLHNLIWLKYSGEKLLA
jgi:uncharacterized protein (UPF0332 family)